MATEEWGLQMSLALKAVRAMHVDSSRLLLDLDRTLVGYTSVYRSVATIDSMSYDIKKPDFMTDGVFRHWVHPSQADTVIAVNLAFWDDNVDLKEPFFIAAKIRYAEPLPNPWDRNKAWDPWHAYLSWTNPREVDLLSEAKPPEDRADILRAVSVGTPLSRIATEASGARFLNLVKSFNFV